MDDLSIEGARCVRPRRTQGFWRRQFDDAPTPAQRKFDVAFGVVMPVLCFAFDPVVFKGGMGGGGGLYQHYQFYAYALSALGVLALCAWLFAAGRVGRVAAALAGVMLAGAAFSFIVGLSILPYSLVGFLLLFVGVFGFVPFLTALVYLRNAWRAAAALGSVGSPALAAVMLAWGFAFAVGAPAFAHVGLTGEVASAMSDVRAGRELSTRRLQALRVLGVVSGSAAYDELVWEYAREGDRARAERLAEVYSDITLGEDIQHRLAVLSD